MPGNPKKIKDMDFLHQTGSVDNKTSDTELAQARQEASWLKKIEGIMIGVSEMKTHQEISAQWAQLLLWAIKQYAHMGGVDLWSFFNKIASTSVEVNVQTGKVMCNKQVLWDKELVVYHALSAYACFMGEDSILHNVQQLVRSTQDSTSNNPTMQAFLQKINATPSITIEDTSDTEGKTESKTTTDDAEHTETKENTTKLEDLKFLESPTNRFKKDVVTWVSARLGVEWHASLVQNLLSDAQWMNIYFAAYQNIIHRLETHKDKMNKLLSNTDQAETMNVFASLMKWDISDENMEQLVNTLWWAEAIENLGGPSQNVGVWLHDLLVQRVQDKVFIDNTVDKTIALTKYNQEHTDGTWVGKIFNDYAHVKNIVTDLSDGTLTDQTLLTKESETLILPPKEEVKKLKDMINPKSMRWQASEVARTYGKKIEEWVGNSDTLSKVNDSLQFYKDGKYDNVFELLEDTLLWQILIMLTSWMDPPVFEDGYEGMKVNALVWGMISNYEKLNKKLDPTERKTNWEKIYPTDNALWEGVSFGNKVTWYKNNTWTKTWLEGENLSKTLAHDIDVKSLQSVLSTKIIDGNTWFVNYLNEETTFADKQDTSLAWYIKTELPKTAQSKKLKGVVSEKDIVSLLIKRTYEKKQTWDALSTNDKQAYIFSAKEEKKETPKTKTIEHTCERDSSTGDLTITFTDTNTQAEDHIYSLDDKNTWKDLPKTGLISSDEIGDKTKLVLKKKWDNGTETPVDIPEKSI